MVLLPWLALKPIGLYAFSTFERLIIRDGNKSLILALLGLIVFWHIYTPIHELLHVGACLLGGGEVSELALKPQYGGHLLAKIFPFVVPESDYAGQLTGFTTPNAVVYAFVDYAPYVLSLFGLVLMVWVRRGQRAFMFGLAVILTFIPLMSIPGDYYEAVSLLTTKVAEGLYPQQPTGFLISDDVFASASALKEQGLLSGPIVMLLVLGLLGAIHTALITLALQLVIAKRLFGADFLQIQEQEDQAA